MINVSLSFLKPVEILILLPLSALAGAWAFARFKNGGGVSFVPVAVLNFILLGIWAVLIGVTHDEAVHMHLAWLITQGLVPYRDFWQHTSPFLWVLMAPFLGWAKPSVELFDLMRVFAGMVFLVNILIGWQIARLVWGERAKLSLYLLVLSSVAMSAQFLLLRPDVFMTFFLLAAIRLSLDIPGERPWPAFLAGISVTLAASFIAKQYFLCLLPVLAVFAGKKEGRAGKLALYLLGLAVGILPFLSYLFSHQIGPEYLKWAFRFNSKIVSLYITFPFGVMALALAAAGALWGLCRGPGGTKARILLLAFILSTLSSLTTTTTVGGGYYLALWFYLSAVVASGCDLGRFFGRLPSAGWRAAAFGLAAGVFLASSVSHLLQYKNRSYSAERSVVAQLLNYCAGDNCLAIAPAHPVFALDATMLYSFWQYRFADNFKSVRQDIRRKPVAGHIMALRPAVVLCRYLKRDFILDLYQKDLISASDYKKLVVFFKDHYTQKRIGQQEYYIRNDRLLEKGPPSPAAGEAEDEQ